MKRHECLQYQKIYKLIMLNNNPSNNSQSYMEKHNINCIRLFFYVIKFYENFNRNLLKVNENIESLNETLSNPNAKLEKVLIIIGDIINSKPKSNNNYIIYFKQKLEFFDKIEDKTINIIILKNINNIFRMIEEYENSIIDESIKNKLLVYRQLIDEFENFVYSIIKISRKSLYKALNFPLKESVKDNSPIKFLEDLEKIIIYMDEYKYNKDFIKFLNVLRSDIFLNKFYWYLMLDMYYMINKIPNNKKLYEMKFDICDISDGKMVDFRFFSLDHHFEMDLKTFLNFMKDINKFMSNIILSNYKPISA